MSFQAKSFSIELSSNELLYLASLFGEARFFLPKRKDEFANTLDTKKSFKNARDSLQQRGLLKISSQAYTPYQVDRTLATIVRFLSAPQTLITLQSHTKSGNAHFSAAYYLANTLLFVEGKDPYRFTFFPSCEDLFSLIITFLGIEGQNLKDIPPLHVVQAEYLLPLIWQNENKAFQALKHFGLSKEDSLQTIKILKEGFQWALIEKSIWKEGSLHRETGIFIAMLPKHLLSGLLPPHDAPPFFLKTQNADSFKKQLSLFLA